MKAKTLFFLAITLLFPVMVCSTALAQPTITTQPVDQIVNIGDAVTFTVAATPSAGTLTYQWTMNGVAILDNATAIAASLNLTATAGHNGAVFRCVVTDDNGSVYSDPATLTVLMPPVIITEPEDQTVVVGQRATFRVIATGNPALVYQWFKGPSGGPYTAIPGATRSSYRTVPTTMADDQTEFYCNVSNSVDPTGVNTVFVTLTVEPRLPTFVIHPEDRTVEVGGVAVFRVWALGTDLEYQWQSRPSGGVWADIPGATDMAYSTGPVNVADHHDRRYRCRVNNTGYTTFVFSNEATLTVIGAPTFTTHPADQTVDDGETATFSIVAIGMGPLSYQWEKMPFGGAWAAIPGATGTSYTTPPTTMADDQAQFRCNVTNATGTVTSASATLTVLGAGAPVITSHPANQTVYEGQTASFTVVATGTSPLNYQWQEMPPAGTWTDIPGATSASYTTPLVVAADDGTSFRCIVTNTDGTATSGPAVLTVLAPSIPVVITNPSSQTVCEGSTATFTVVATDTVPLSYQWQENGVDIPGATSASYTTLPAPLGDSGNTYLCNVSNAAGTTPSAAATLTVIPVSAPIIVANPLSQTVCIGETATFDVVVADTCPPFAYQWQRNGTDIPGATSASYTTPPVTLAESGDVFDCVITNAGGSVTTTVPGTLTVDGTLPTIITNPSNQTACIGQAATFTVEAATSCPPLSYQWQRNGVDIPGATSASYTTPPVSAGETGDVFLCNVTNAAGITPSAGATLTVDATAPTILTQPSNQTACIGQTATFTVEANSACLPISYQWQRNGVDIPGATSASYTTPPVSLPESGDTFLCNVSNSAGTTPSAAVILTVDATAPTILTQPLSQSVFEGQTATFTVEANSACLPIFYQWVRGATDIAGATSASYTTPPTTLADNGALFTCRVSNAAGTTVTAPPATLTVQAGVVPTITTQPVDQTVNEGETATFTVVAIGTPPLSYQWRRNGTNISGATTASYTTPPVAIGESGDTFDCVVSNVIGSATSSTATLTVHSGSPTITVDPLDQAVFEGQMATFIVVAGGTAPLNYQWEKMPSGGAWALIPGATGASHTTPAATSTDDQAQFRCTVTNAFGSATSNAATLTVQSSAPIITTQPLDQAVSEGQSATFNVVATGMGTLFYQWEKMPFGGSWALIPGATAATYNTPLAVLADDQAQFRCKVTNTYGSATSNAATLTVQSGVPSVTTHPISQAVFEGQVASFGIIATGSAPLFYQWEKMPSGGAWAPIPGAVLSGYTTQPTTLADDQAQFRCKVTNTYGSATSNAATLTVQAAAPTITMQPLDQTVTEGDTAAFSVAASGSTPFSYQWQEKPFGGVWADIAGATSASYTTPATTLADDQAEFRCKVTNAAGMATSNSATLTVQSSALPTIIQHPQDQSVNEGNTATFTVVATGAGPLSYQWERDGSYITGATSSSYTTDPTVAGDDGARFRCEVSSAGGTVTSNEAELTVLTEPTAAFPFTEDFETGSLAPYWSPFSTGKGRIQVTALNDPAAGSYHLTMDSSTWVSFARNELVLNVNLNGQTGVMLNFYHKEFNDDNHVMPASFTGSHNSDGVAISEDGTTWYKVQGLTSADGTSSDWQAYTVDLDAAAAAAGISYNSAFKIKFQQYGKNPIVSSSFRFSDGFAFDDIELY